MPYPEDAKASTPEKLAWTDEEIMDYAVQLFLDSLPKLDESDGGEQKNEQKRLFKDFFATEDREEQEAILQKIYNGTLTQEEMEKFFSKD